MVYPAQVNAQTQMLLRFFSPWDYKDFDCTPEPKVGDVRQFKSLEMTFSFEKEFKWVLFIPTVTLPGLLFSTPITLPFPCSSTLQPRATVPTQIFNPLRTCAIQDGDSVPNDRARNRSADGATDQRKLGRAQVRTATAARDRLK